MKPASFQFRWDPQKASGNIHKHGITFELATTVFQDPHLIAVADIDHSQAEDRWRALGLAANGRLIAVVYVLSDLALGGRQIRIISARKATTNEAQQYQEDI